MEGDQMVTLKELVEEQRWNDSSDVEVIKQFFTLNDMEEQAIDLISELSKSKVRKLKQKNYMAEEWVTILPSKYLYEKYDLDVADRLHMMELDYLMNGGELSKKKLKWAKENVPNIKEPEAYFQPLIRYLEENGIKFKERKGR